MSMTKKSDTVANGRINNRPSMRGLVIATAIIVAVSFPVVSVFAGTRSSAVPVAYHRPRRLVSWQNAPSPDPGYLDGYYMLYNPLKPSDGPYPALRRGEKLWIDVSISQQLVYIFHGNHVVYTMATSSGMQNVKGDGSPPGVYQIQRERGKWFYVKSEHVGAKYWVSWHGNGVFLFHSVPMTHNKKIMPYVAARLLHEASFGCFLLTVPDAKWIYHNVPYGTTVIVQRPPVLIQGNKIFDPNEMQSLAIFMTSGAKSASGS